MYTDVYQRFIISLGKRRATWHRSQGCDCVARELKWKINLCPWILRWICGREYILARDFLLRSAGCLDRSVWPPRSCTKDSALLQEYRKPKRYRFALQNASHNNVLCSWLLVQLRWKAQIPSAQFWRTFGLFLIPLKIIVELLVCFPWVIYVLFFLITLLPLYTVLLSFNFFHVASAILESQRGWCKVFWDCLAALRHVAVLMATNKFFFRTKKKIVTALGWVLNLILILFHLSLLLFHIYFTFYFHLLLF